MASHWTQLNSGRDSGILQAAYCEKRWYAAYTSANHERRVAEQLAVRDVDHFLPVYASVRRWKDRRVTLQMPLFPGYVFVCMALRDRLQVQQVPGVAHLVGFDGTPAALPDAEIQALMRGVESGLLAEPHPYLKVGHRVRVRAGPLQGLQGILVRKKNVSRFVISLDLIMRSVAAEIDLAELEPVR